MKLRAGIRFIVVALVLFVLVIGAVSALTEIATITRVQVDSAVDQIDLSLGIVTNQVKVTLAGSAGSDPFDALRNDRRLAQVIQDAGEYNQLVQYILIADSRDQIITHSLNPGQVGTTALARAELTRQDDIPGNLRQFKSIVSESGVYEKTTRLDLNGRYFCSVRVGLGATLLTDELNDTLREHILKLIAQVLLTAGFGVAISWIMILRPLSRIEKGIEHLQRGDFSYKVPEGGGDELGKLASQINVLSETLDRTRQDYEQETSNLQHEGDALRRIVDAVDDGLLMFDASRRIMMANRTIARIVGVDLPDLTGRRLDDVIDGGHPLARLIDESLNRSGPPESSQIELGTESGNRTFLATCQIIGDARNRQGGVITLRDYGRVREVQGLLDHARVLSRLGKMAAGVAHEIRNPLNAMNIHLELLRERAASGEPLDGGVEHLTVVKTEIARLERVVYGFLRMARLQEPKFALISVPDFLGELEKLIQPEARMSGVEIVLELDRDLPDIYGDEEVLRQAMLNLIRNAVQASKAGAPPIKVSATADGDGIRLHIQDSGEGMSQDVQDKIFDLYYTTKKDGTGVGLALVQQAVEIHGGTLDLKSCPGEGSTFSLWLPALST